MMANRITISGQRRLLRFDELLAIGGLSEIDVKSCKGHHDGVIQSKDSGYS